jgi:hypothetical protein
MKTFLRRLFALALFTGFALSVSALGAQVIGTDPAEGEILTRGPVHEAFAAVVSYNPEAGILVDRQPPESIEEVPPEEKPVGEDVAWIPGYWGWDDERNDFIWISGTWRVLPPGRAWIAGYWRQADRGWQWVSGYWEDAGRREVSYLPPPPATLERGPSVPAPSPDYAWAPGCWEWRHDRYAWRPGYWIEGRSDWMWIPSYYIWTPRGYVFVQGYWDYVPRERGLLFAPVYYREYRRPRYDYRPSIVLNVTILSDHLFLRPRYCHYYFGDYYDLRYERSGFYATHIYQTSRFGYDPFYSHSRWEHRRDRDWDRRHREAYDHRRRHESARPPRIWSGSSVMVDVEGGRARAASGNRKTSYAQPIQQYAENAEAPVRVERVAATRREQDIRRARDVQQQRTQRRTLEAQKLQQTRTAAPVPAEVSTHSASAPATVALPVSPIVARSETSSSRRSPPRVAAPELRERTSLRAERSPATRDGAPAVRPQPSTTPREKKTAPRVTGTNPPTEATTPTLRPNAGRSDNPARAGDRRTDEPARVAPERAAEQRPAIQQQPPKKNQSQSVRREQERQAEPRGRQEQARGREAQASERREEIRQPQVRARPEQQQQQHTARSQPKIRVEGREQAEQQRSQARPQSEALRQTRDPQARAAGSSEQVRRIQPAPGPDSNQSARPAQKSEPQPSRKSQSKEEEDRGRR